MHTESSILDLLEARYSSDAWREEWVFFRLFRVGIGWEHPWDRTLDAWAMNCYPSKQFRTIAFEVKTTRGDFRRELKPGRWDRYDRNPIPRKLRAALEASNQMYFVAPDGVIPKDELPEQCGLMVVRDDSLRVVRGAPYREDGGLLDWNFVASICRRVQRKERELL